MIITVILVALAIAIGSLAMYGFYCYGELKGWERGFDDCETCYKEVRDETTV